MDAATAAKIKNHKWGKRKLATDSAWQSMMRKLDAEEYAGFRHDVVTLQSIIDQVVEINDAFDQALAALHYHHNTDPYFTFSAEKPFIPRSVWMGYIDLPTGSLSSADRTAFQTAEAKFADHCGQFRKELAKAYDIYSVINDLANVPGARPNKGGVVGPDNT